MCPVYRCVVAPTDADLVFPSMGKMRDHQDIYTGGNEALDSLLVSVVRGENRLY